MKGGSLFKLLLIRAAAAARVHGGSNGRGAEEGGSGTFGQGVLRTEVVSFLFLVCGDVYVYL